MGRGYWLLRDDVIAAAGALFDAANASPGEDGVLAAAWRAEAQYQALLDAVRDVRTCPVVGAATRQTIHIVDQAREAEGL